MRKVLTPEKLEHAKFLKEQGKTKRELAFIFQVGETTIWENLYRKKIYIDLSRPICSNCEIFLTKIINYHHIPINFQIGNKCITCFLEGIGLNYKDIFMR